MAKWGGVKNCNGKKKTPKKKKLLEGKINRVGLRESRPNWVLLLGIFKKRNNSSATAGGVRSVNRGVQSVAGES